MIGDQTAHRLRLIRNAGLQKVRKAAAACGRQDVGRDMQVLRDVANGSTPQAAAKNNMSESTVRHIVKRYAQIAEEILSGR